MKKVLSLIIALTLVLTTVIAGAAVQTAAADKAAAPTGDNLTGKIYFDTGNTGWTNFTYVRFHIWAIDDPSFVGFDWGGKKQQGVDEGNGVWSYDLANCGGIKEGCQYAVIFYNSNGSQTYNLLFGAECIGATASVTGVIYENPEDSQKTTQAAFWNGIDPEQYGPELMITSIGNVVGVCLPHIYSSKAGLFDFFLRERLENAREFAGKTDQQLIDDTASDLGLTKDEAEQAIKDSGLEVAWDRSKSTLPGEDPLPAPTGLTATNVSNNVLLKWKAVTGAVKYVVFMSPTGDEWALSGETTAASYTVKNLTTCKTYYFRVQAISASGNADSDYSKAVSIRYIKMLAKPVISSITNVVGKTTVAWKKVAGATAYVLFTNASGKLRPFATTQSTSCSFVGVQAGKTYQYAVQCINVATSEFVSPQSDIKSYTYIAPPTIKSVANVYGGVKLTLNKASGASKYRVFYKVGSGKWTKLADTTALTVTHKKTVSGKKYTYAVRAINAKGTAYTSALGTAKAVTYVAAPVPVSAVKVKNGVKFTWKKSAGAVKYRVFRKAGAGKWAKLGDTKTLYFVDTKVKKKVKYTYTVCAVTADGKTLVSAYNPTGKAILYK